MKNLKSAIEFFDTDNVRVVTLSGEAETDRDIATIIAGSKLANADMVLSGRLTSHLESQIGIQTTIGKIKITVTDTDKDAPIVTCTGIVTTGNDPLVNWTDAYEQGHA